MVPRHLSPSMVREETARVFHSLYGLRIEANVALPGIPILSNSDGLTDIRLRLRQDEFPLSLGDSRREVKYESRFTASNGEPIFRAFASAGGTHFEFAYDDGARFVIARDGSEVFADWPDRLTLEDISPYIVGPVLGFALRLRGVFSLHASAVAIGNHAVVLMGPAGAGKSTTAGAFARCGHRVISDDVAALRPEGSRFVIPSGYPRVNLWAESAQALFGAAQALPRISPGWDKHFMPLDQESQFETRSLPLGAIYAVQRCGAKLAVPIVEEVTGAEVFLALLGNTYMNYLPDPELQRAEFEVLGRLSQQVPVRRVRVPDDPSRLFDVCKTISADVKKSLGIPVTNDSQS